MRRSASALILLLALAIAAAGCGGGGSSDNTKNSSGGSAASSSSGGGYGGYGGGSQTATPASSASSSGTAVTLKDIAFAPSHLTVKAAQKVTWTNQDSVAHNVTATKGATFKSQNLAQGDTFTFTPKQAGTITYACTLHPGMTATLTVTK